MKRICNIVFKKIWAGFFSCVSTSVFIACVLRCVKYPVPVNITMCVICGFAMVFSTLWWGLVDKTLRVACERFEERLKTIETQWKDNNKENKQ